MRQIKWVGWLSLLGFFLSGCYNMPGPIGVGLGVGAGPEPDCPYGYFDYSPYNCAPYGYYGTDWFSNGMFMGAGPWFHGPDGFYGHVDNRWDPRGGYNGPLPGRGERAFHGFQANEARNGMGHVGIANHNGSMEHVGGFVGRGRPGGLR